MSRATKRADRFRALFLFGEPDRRLADASEDLILSEAPHAYLHQRSRRRKRSELAARWRCGRRRRAGRRLPDQAAARAALLRPAHPADPQDLLRRQHVALPRASIPATGTALGNLDLTSFEGVQKRRDVLRTYGSYPQPLLLLKALPEEQVQIPYQRQASTRARSGTRAASRSTPNSDAYFELKRWLDNGANRDGIAPGRGAQDGHRAPAATALPPAEPAHRRSTPRRPPTRRSSTTIDAAPAERRAPTAPATARRRPTST